MQCLRLHFEKIKTPLAIRYRLTTQEMHKKTMSRIRPLSSFDNNYSLSSRKKIVWEEYFEEYLIVR